LIGQAGIGPAASRHRGPSARGLATILDLGRLAKFPLGRAGLVRAGFGRTLKQLRSRKICWCQYCSRLPNNHRRALSGDPRERSTVAGSNPATGSYAVPAPALGRYLRVRLRYRPGGRQPRRPCATSAPWKNWRFPCPRPNNRKPRVREREPDPTEGVAGDRRCSIYPRSSCIASSLQPMTGHKRTRSTGSVVERVRCDP
jgi:hypothetical protein